MATLGASMIYSPSIPSLTTPVFIQGSTSVASSRSVNDLLIDHTNAVQFAKLYSPHFPDCFEAVRDGVGYLLHYEFYASTRYNPALVLLVSDCLLLPSVTTANYEVFTAILSFIMRLGGRYIISYGYFPSVNIEDTICVETTSKALVQEIALTAGGYSLPEEELSAAMELILGLAKQHAFLGICLLKPILGQRPPNVAILSIFKHLLTLLQMRS